MSGAPVPSRILFVCTANICRSPAAEYLARGRFGEQSALFRSAGFLTHGESCPAPLLRSLSDVGVDASSHRSYRIDDSSLRAADLVLTMEGQHVQRATLLLDAAFARVVPLKEAAELLGLVRTPSVGVDDLLELVAQRRDPRSYLTSRWDVEDPYRRKLKDYRRAVAEIDRLVETVVGRLV